MARRIECLINRACDERSKITGLEFGRSIRMACLRAALRKTKAGCGRNQLLDVLEEMIEHYERSGG